MIFTKAFILAFLFPCFLYAREVRVAIIDSGLNRFDNVHLCKDGLIDITNSTMISEYEGHGNNITHIITDTLPYNSYCIIEIKAYSLLNLGKDRTRAALAIAIERKADIVNISAGGPGRLLAEEQLINLAKKQGIIIIAAAGNEHDNLDNDCNFFPACYANVISVGNLHNELSNYGKRITVWRDGNNITAGGRTLSGTSQACAIFTRDFIKKLLNKGKK